MEGDGEVVDEGGGDDEGEEAGDEEGGGEDITVLLIKHWLAHSYDSCPQGKGPSTSGLHPP